MELSVSIGLWAAAVLPILFLFLAITLWGWSTHKAAMAGVILAGGIGIWFYKLAVPGLLSECGKGVWNALSILLVIWPAIFIYEVTEQAGGFRAIRQGIQRLTRHELLQIVIMGWIFPDFLQGITGFGVAVAVGAPLLVSIGVRPLWSIVMVLLSYSWGATFGTLALSWEALLVQAELTGEAAGAAAFLAAGLIGCYIVVMAFCLFWFYGKWKAVKAGLPLGAVLVLIRAGGQLLLAPISPSIACFLPSAAALAAAVLMTRLPCFRKPWRMEDSPVMDRREQEEGMEAMSFHQGFFPYYVLTAITVFCLLVPPVNRFLGQFRIGFSFPEVCTGMGYVTPEEPFYSPMSPLIYAGTILAEACLISALYYRAKGRIRKGDLSQIWRRTVKKSLPSTAAILGFAVMARIMSSSGQIQVLSYGIVQVLGSSYVAAAPLFGIIGTFITSSNMSSNILFGKFQMSAAEFLQISPAVTLALQTAGGAVGAAMAPGSMILGMSTTGIKGVESSILKKVMPISIGSGIAFGIAAWLFLI